MSDAGIARSVEGVIATHIVDGSSSGVLRIRCVIYLDGTTEVWINDRAVSDRGAEHLALLFSRIAMNESPLLEIPDECLQVGQVGGRQGPDPSNNDGHGV